MTLHTLYTMPDKVYKEGRIYKLYSHINEYYYIGSTHTTLRQRKCKHLTKNGVSQKVSNWVEDVGRENVRIIEIEHYENITRTQLRQHEDFEIQKHLGQEFCLNTLRAYISPGDRQDRKLFTSKQWCENNKDHRSKYRKQYREINRNKIKEYTEKTKDKTKDWRATSYYCIVCDKMLQKGDKSHHEKRSIKHIKNFILY